MARALLAHGRDPLRRHSADADRGRRRCVPSCAADRDRARANVADELNIAIDHEALSFEGHKRGDVEMVARHHDEVEPAGGTHHPIELWEGVVKVRDEKDTHAAGREYGAVER